MHKQFSRAIITHSLFSRSYATTRAKTSTGSKVAINVPEIEQRVNFLWQNGQAEQALSTLQEHLPLINRKERDTYLLFNKKLAAIHFAQGRSHEAEKILAEMLSLEDLDETTQANIITSVSGVAHEDKAIQFLRTKTKHDVPEVNSRIHAEIGNMFLKKSTTVTAQGPNATVSLKLDALEEAILHYDKALELLADNDIRTSFAMIYLNRGVACQSYADLNIDATEQERNTFYDRAKADYTSAIALNPELYIAYLKRGDVWARTNDTNTALSDYSKFEEKFEEFCKTEYAASTFLFLHVNYFSALSKEELYFELLLKKSVMYIYFGDNNMAIQQLEQFLTLDDDVIINKEKMKKLKAIAHHKIGYCYMIMKKYNSVVESNSKAILLDPKLVFAYRDRAIAYEELGRANEAKEDKKVLEYLTREMVLART
jgi:tetratricopeptide (TPR) repeat protein